MPVRFLFGGVNLVVRSSKGWNRPIRDLSVKLLDEQGNLHKFVNVFVADDDVRYLKGLDTEVSGGQTVSIVPAVAGGR